MQTRGLDSTTLQTPSYHHIHTTQHNSQQATATPKLQLYYSLPGSPFQVCPARWAREAPGTRPSEHVRDRDKTIQSDNWSLEVVMWKVPLVTTTQQQQSVKQINWGHLDPLPNMNP